MCVRALKCQWTTYNATLSVYMPFSKSAFKKEIREYFYSTFKDKNMRILDVGPGAGTYAQLLAPDFKMDAVEIFEPYIATYNLRNLYNTVHLADIRDFDVSNYDYLIMGDVLEHLSYEDSIKLLNRVKDKKYLVAVPYLYPQGAYYGNIHETHLQPDLTEEIVIQRYNLKKLYGNTKYGYFINY